MSTTSLAGSIRTATSGSSAANDTLLSSNFEPTDYIRQRMQGVREGQETRQLRLLRSEMSAANQASSELLKNNVFKNYHQFIDASKEISHLEREIYQLSAMLNEQKNVMESLMGIGGDDRSSIHTVSSHTTTSSVNPLHVLMQKVDGIAGIMNSARATDRIILHGEMTYLDGETKQPICKHLLILLNDRLIVCVPSPGGKYSVEATFSLHNLASVNVRDREAIGSSSAQQLIKLLIFPEQRYYLCESTRAKKQWLDELENAKRALLHENSLVRQATIRGRRKSTQARAAEASERGSASPKLASIADEVDGEEDKENCEEERLWLQALPAEVDDCIANRDIEQAVELVVEWRACSTSDPTVDTQMQAREQQIVSLLSDDVRRPGAVHGGPRAMKKARTLLTQIGRGSYAVDLYLKRRSALQRAASKDVAVSEEPLSYVKQLTNIFTSAVADVATEFHSQPEYYCQVVQWSSGELSVLLNLVRRHVIEVAPTMAVLTYTWRILMSCCDELTSIGVQLTFEVHRLLGPAMQTALETNFGNVMHGLRLRMLEEKWRPYILESESALTRLKEELSDLGLQVEVAIGGRTTLNISPHSLHFARMAHTLSRDLAPLISSPCRSSCDAYMMQLWTEYLSHISEPPANQSLTYEYSANFVVEEVLPLCERTYGGDEEDILSRLLSKHFPQLNKFINKYGAEEDGLGTSEEKEMSEDDEELAHV